MVRDFLQEKKKALDKTVNYFVLLAGVLGSLFSLFLWGGEKGKEKTKRQKWSACTFAVHAKIEYCLIKLYLDVYVVVHIINVLRQQVFCNIFLCNHYYCWNFVNMTTKQKEKEKTEILLIVLDLLVYHLSIHGNCMFSSRNLDGLIFWAGGQVNTHLDWKSLIYPHWAV